MPTRWDDIAESLRRQTRQLVSLRGVACLMLVIVTSLWTFGVIDWAVHLDSRWVRLLAATGILTAVGFTLWKTLLRPLSVRLTDVDIARTIERRFPEWGDRLSSAAQFRTEHQSERLGSPLLQQTVTDDVDRRLGGIDVERILAPKSTWRLAFIAATVCLVGIIGAFLNSTATATVIQRLAMPFANVEWPQTTRLQFLNADLQRLGKGPQRTAAGQQLILYVENTLGALPEDATLQLRLPDGRNEERPLQTTVLRDEDVSHEVGIASLLAHAGPVSFRAVGGDDRQMPWRTLEVVPPPVLASVTMTITPPDYTAQEARILNGAGAIEALVGSEIRIEAESNQPLAYAKLRREDQPPQAMQVSDGGRRFEASFRIETAGRSWYWFDIADEHELGQSNPPRYEIRALSDRKPTVFLETPATDLTVTADAEVPLRIIARDDLGVRELRLVHSRAGAAAVRIPLELSSELVTDETVETTWNLADLELAPGDRITYFAEAVDAFDLPVPEDAEARNNAPPTDVEVRPMEIGQVGISSHRHLDILTSDEKRQELAARQMGILDALESLKERQSQALENTAGLRIQAELVEKLQADDLDLLKQTELEQQGIHDQLADERSGTAVELGTLQQELTRNHIDDPQMASRLAELAEDVRLLNDELLPGVEQSLARARKLSQADRQQTVDSSTQQQLRIAEQQQSTALAILEEATERLGGWRRQYEVTSQLDGLISDQTDIQQETESVGRKTLTKRPSDLASQEQADLARLSDRQRRLASRLDELLKRGTQDEQSQEEPSPVNSDAMREALRRLAERDTLSHMHQAAESLKRNDITRTAESQQQVLSDLRDFGELLQSGTQDTAETLLSRIEEQTEEVETLRKRQQQLSRDAQQAMGPSADPDRTETLQRLSKQQEELAERAEQLARQLRRQRQGQSGQSAARAARRMREAEEAIEQEQPEQTAKNQQDALDDLAQLAGELGEQQQELEHELARQQVEQLADELQGLADRQGSLIEITVDLDVRQRERGSWSRSLRKELRDATSSQMELTKSVEQLQGGLNDFLVVLAALERAVDPMQETVKQLEQSDVGDATVEHQRTAQQRLLAIVAVMAQSKHADAEKGQEGDPQQTPPRQPGGQSQQRPPILLETQLRLLRHLQADVQERTAVLTKQLSEGEVQPDEVAAQRESLAGDQGRIAELTRTLLEQFSQGAQNPAAVPPDGKEQP